MTSTILDRFWSRVDKTDPNGCWLWKGYLEHGYGYFCLYKQTRIRAHRFVYEITNGPIPSGLVLDHLCRVRHCVNPAHLEPVTNKENILRGEGLPAQNLRKTHCKHGHLIDGIDHRGNRRCNECRRAEKRRYYYRRKAAA